MSWEQSVFSKYGGVCANCGGSDRLKAKMIVPLQSGGLNVETNGVLLCRPCDLASEATLHAGADPQRKLVNFWVSRPLYDWMQGDTGFTSMGALIRYLMTKYVKDENRFDDLQQYQDTGSDVKINVWVDPDSYKVFKTLIEKRGMTVTDSFKALLKMYQIETAPVVVESAVEE